MPSILDTTNPDSTSGFDTPIRAPSKNLAANAIVLMTGGLIAAGLSAVAGLLIARHLGPLDYGKYSIAVALASAFTYAFLFGLDSILAREIARKSQPLSTLVPSAFFPSVLWSTVLAGIIVVTARLLSYSVEVQNLVIVVAVTTALKALTSLFRSTFRGIERLELDALVQILGGVIDLTLVVIVLALVGTAMGASLGLLLGAGIVLIAVIGNVSRMIGGDYQFDEIIAKSLVENAIPLGITFLIIGASLRIDMLVLSLFEPELNVGFYAAAFGCIMLTRPLSQSSAALLPRISALDADKDPRIESVIADGLRYTLLMGGMITIMITLLAPNLLRTLYGAAFLPSVPSLRILGLVAGLLFINTYLWNVLISIRQAKVILLAAIAGLIFGLGIALLLIPQVGIVGGAIAALVRESVGLAILGTILTRKIPNLISSRTLFGFAAASIAAVIVLWPVRMNEELSAILWIIPAFGLYTFLLILTNTIRRSEVVTMVQIVAQWTRGGNNK